MNDCLEAEFRDHLVLAQPESRQLFVLNPVAAFIWKARKAAFSEQEISKLLADRLAIPKHETARDVSAVFEQFSCIGARFERGRRKHAAHHTRRSASVFTQDACFWTIQLGMAEQSVLLGVQDSHLTGILKPIVAHLEADFESHDTRILLAGTQEQWELSRDGHICAPIDPHPIANIIHHLVEAACCSERQLLTVHGAGLSIKGRGILLVGAGGSGKTTLAAALNADGVELLSDDVVPITPDGRMLSVGMSLCLKQGSWDVLEAHVPVLNRQPPIERFGSPVRFVPPPGKVASSPCRTSLFLFPRYDPDCEAGFVKLDAIEVLQGLIDSDSLILDLDQDRLSSMLDWVVSAPGYRIHYPDLSSGKELVMHLARQVIS